MKLIIAGSRDISPSVSFIQGCIQLFQLEGVTEVVSGGAKGVDTIGEIWAGRCKEYIVTQFLADWDTHGKKAGVLRNKEMAIYADALLLIWDGVSRGSANMRKEMLALGKPVYEVVIRRVV